MSTRRTIRTGALAGLSWALLGAATLPATAPAQEAAPNEYRATVYGMVCNQCAYGVEQSLQHTDGVADALVDLKNGSVVVKATASPPEARTVVEKIRAQGVSVRKLEATLTGRLEETSGDWRLVLGGHRVSVRRGADAPALSSNEGQQVSATGTFEGVKGVDDASGPVRFVLSGIGG